MKNLLVLILVSLLFVLSCTKESSNASLRGDPGVGEYILHIDVGDVLDTLIIQVGVVQDHRQAVKEYHYGGVSEVSADVSAGKYVNVFTNYKTGMDYTMYLYVMKDNKRKIWEKSTICNNQTDHMCQTNFNYLSN